MTKPEMIDFFKKMAYEYEKRAHRNNDDPILYAKAEAYELAAFQLEYNMD